MSGPRYLAVCLNPVMQRTLLFPSWKENEVNRTSEYYLHASGKGLNVARVLTQLGDDAIHLTHAGGRDRDRFLEMCRSDGVRMEWVDSGSEIRTCTTVLSRDRGTSTELVEEAFPVGPDTDRGVRETFNRLIPETDVLIISGTRAPGYSSDLYAWMSAAAASAGAMTLLDIKGADLEGCLPHKPAVIKPNLAEFCATFLPELSVGEHDDDPAVLQMVRGRMQEIFERYGTAVILTRGSRGVLSYDGSEFCEVPARSLKPVNTIGCGDAFTAGFAHSYARSGNMGAALEKGTECAAANALQVKPGSILA